MNMRMHELFLESWGRLTYETDGPLFQFDRDQLNKFAESIVQECASICELNGQSYKHSFAPAKAKLAESTSVYCGTLIKKHFGVEE